MIAAALRDRRHPDLLRVVPPEHPWLAPTVSDGLAGGSGARAPANGPAPRCSKPTLTDRLAAGLEGAARCVVAGGDRRRGDARADRLAAPAIPRAYYTGTNSVGREQRRRERSNPARRCACPNVNLPADTGRVQLCGVRAPPPTFTAPPCRSPSPAPPELLTDDRRAGARPRWRYASAPIPLPAILARVGPRDRLSDAARRPGGAPGGMIGFCRPTRRRRRLPSSGTPLSEAAFRCGTSRPRAPSARCSRRAGAIFSRTALFRPGVVGAWTYPPAAVRAAAAPVGACAAAACPRRASSRALPSPWAAPSAPSARDRVIAVPQRRGVGLITPAVQRTR